MSQLTLLIALLLLSFFQFYICRKKNIKQNLTIMKLQNRLSSLQENINNTNRRKEFRLELESEPLDGVVQLLDYEDNGLKKLKGKKAEAKIINLSSNGSKVELIYDLPIYKKIFVGLEFMLNDESFKIEGYLIRKETLLNKQEIAYGIKFKDLDSMVERKLVAHINSLLAQKRK